MSDHGEKDAGDLRTYLTGDLPGRPEDELVGVVLRLCEVVDQQAAELTRLRDGLQRAFDTIYAATGP